MAPVRCARVVRPEVMAPLAHTMALIDHKSGELSSAVQVCEGFLYPFTSSHLHIRLSSHEDELVSAEDP
jgi:hypothetical protein